MGHGPGVRSARGHLVWVGAHLTSSGSVLHVFAGMRRRLGPRMAHPAVRRSDGEGVTPPFDTPASRHVRPIGAGRARRHRPGSGGPMAPGSSSRPSRPGSPPLLELLGVKAHVAAEPDVRDPIGPRLGEHPRGGTASSAAASLASSRGRGVVGAALIARPSGGCARRSTVRSGGGSSAGSAAGQGTRPASSSRSGSRGPGQPTRADEADIGRDERPPARPQRVMTSPCDSRIRRSQSAAERGQTGRRIRGRSRNRPASKRGSARAVLDSSCAILLIDATGSQGHFWLWASISLLRQGLCRNCCVRGAVATGATGGRRHHAVAGKPLRSCSTPASSAARSSVLAEMPARWAAS